MVSLRAHLGTAAGLNALILSLLVGSVDAFVSPAPPRCSPRVKQGECEYQNSRPSTASVSPAVTILPRSKELVGPLNSKRGIGGSEGLATGSDESGKIPLQGPDNILISALLKGEVLVLLLAAGASAFFGIDPLANAGLSAGDVQLAAGVAVGLAVASTIVEKSIKSLREVDRDTQTFVLRLFGAERNPVRSAAPAVVLSAGAGIAEEMLFRGVLLRGLAPIIGPFPSAIVSAVAFGLAHGRSPALMAVLESVYGLAFGSVFLATGYNVAPAILCHFFYDLITFLQIHIRATERFAIAAAKASTDTSIGGDLNTNRIWTKDREARARAVFIFMDTDGSGTINLRELENGMKALGKMPSEQEVRELMADMDGNNDGELNYEEFRNLIVPKERS